MSVNSKMTAIADKIRTLLGISGAMGLDAMSDNLGAAVNECDTQADLISQLKGAITENVTKTANSVSEQSTVIHQLRDAIGENVSKTSSEVSEQASLIAEIKTALEGKAGGGGGTVLPTLTNPATATDMAEGKQLIDANGNVVTGSVETVAGDYHSPIDDNNEIYWDDAIGMHHTFQKDVLFRQGARVVAWVDPELFGNANPEDVRAGVTFTSENGLVIEGTAQMGGGYAIKSGTTTSATINTGLSDVEQFFLYKETITATGLIHLHYTKSATYRMYASAWTTNSWGSKTITNGTGGVTVNGGTVTISATQAAQGALTSGVTYKWVAIGTE